jgi:hypothetical protein
MTAKTAARAAPITRGLSVCGPWSWLIVSDFVKRGQCVKPVENRTWQTNYRGPLAIQESTSDRDFTAEIEDELCEIHPAIEAQLSLSADDDRRIFHPGCLVGAVDVIGCIDFREGGDFEQLCRAAGFGAWYDKHAIPPATWANEGCFCFLLDKPRQFTQPPPAKGALNIYHLSPADQAAIAKCLAAPLGSPWKYRDDLAKAKAKAGKVKA